jgi:2-polyprenyl-6-methoxyphenol hydroxylase-like FAD-dependent oxidoreductase
MTASDEQILIVGGGPTGLTLACQLLLRGVPCRVVDQAPTATTRSRAIGVSPRSLEILDEFDGADELVEHGLPCPAASLYSRGRRIGRVTFEAIPHLRHPFMLAVPQSETERVLGQRLRDLGGHVEREVTVEGVREQASRDGVAVTLAGPNGHEQLSVRWVVGADGAHSTVRKHAGIDFVGADTYDVFVNVDARVDGAPARGEVHYYLSLAGLTIVVPLADGFCRITSSISHIHGQSDQDLALEEVQAMVAERLEGRLAIRELRDAGWGVSRVRVHTRMAERFRRGRMILAGDAAHLYGPIGGQGMNSGIQDAHNLAWRLALLERGCGTERLLDGYDAERRAAARVVQRGVERQTRMALTRNRAVVELRNAVIRRATRTGLLDRRLAPEVGQLEVSYGGSPGIARARRRIPGRATTLGRRVPNAPLVHAGEQGSLFDLLSRHPLSLLVLGAGPHHASTLVALSERMQDLYSDSVGVHMIVQAANGAPDQAELVDDSGILYRHLAITNPSVCLLRADAHLAYSGSLHDQTALFALLDRAYCVRRGAD